MIRGLLSRLTCTDPDVAEQPWVALLLAEAHVHHASAAPDARADADTATLALAVPVSADVAPEEASQAPDPLEPGPPDAGDAGGTARVRVRSPVPVRLLGWEGTFGAGEVPAGRYVVAPRTPPDFEPLGVAALYAAPGDVWSVRCSRGGACDVTQLRGEPRSPAAPEPAEPPADAALQAAP
ncbi:MAG: hypothetical protein R3F59_17110 [Myxococcota bacterium]